jgi:hypothetical protein
VWSGASLPRSTEVSQSNPPHLPEIATRRQNLLNSIAVHIGQSGDGVTVRDLVGSDQPAALEDCQAIRAEIGTASRAALPHFDQVCHLTSTRLSEGASGLGHQLGDDLAALSRSLQCSFRCRLVSFAIRLTLEAMREDRGEHTPLCFRCHRWHKIRLRGAEINKQLLFDGEE